MKLIGKKDDFEVYFDTNIQTYSVFKGGKFLIGDKYKFRQVKSYLD